MTVILRCDARDGEECAGRRERQLLILEIDEIPKQSLRGTLPERVALGKNPSSRRAAAPATSTRTLQRGIFDGSSRNSLSRSVLCRLVRGSARVLPPSTKCPAPQHVAKVAGGAVLAVGAA